MSRIFPRRTASTFGRIRSLDGLRGIAALVVLLHHALLTLPEFAEPYYAAEISSSGPMWWMAYSPLHLLWEGTAAVYVFFILSGIVLTLPIVKAGQSFSWRTYYPQRLVRLYVPVWAAVVFAVLTFGLVARTDPLASAWLQNRPDEPTLAAVARDITLLAGNGNIASPLWSLRWEILFSLLLPFFIWIAVKASRWALPLAILSILMVAGGAAIGRDELRYMPMFMIGVLIAGHLPRLSTLQVRITAMRRPVLIWSSLLALSAVLMTSYWMTAPLGLPESVQSAMAGPTTVGATLAVLLAIFWDGAKRVLESPVIQWCGSVSFSLYLVHEPIVIAFAFLFGPGYETVGIICSIALSLLVAQVFMIIVEKPSYRLAKAVGSRVSKRASPIPAAS